MSDALWNGVEFKLDEAEFFLDNMGKILVPAQYSDPNWHPAWGGDSMSRWQPDFFYYLDAFLGAARSVPDIIQKCFGWDGRSSTDWPDPPEPEEMARRQAYQAEFTRLYADFHRHPLSRVRVGTFHWLGVPSVETKARTPFGEEYTGGPLEHVPSAAARRLPAETEPALQALFGKPNLPVEPSWRDFTLKMPGEHGSTRSVPLFEECKQYIQAARDLVREAKEICQRIHGRGKLMPPPTVAREGRS